MFYYCSYIIGVGAEDYDFPGVQTTQWQRGQAQQVVSFVDYDNDGDDDGEDDSDDEDGEDKEDEKC